MTESIIDYYILLYPHFEYRERDDLDFRNCESRI